MCRKICFILVFVLLGGLAACEPGATPSLVSASSPTAAATATPTFTPTPTETPTLTETPTPPQEQDRDLNYSFSSSIDSENLQRVMETFRGQPDFVDSITEALGYPVVVAYGHTILYELTSDNGERSMYVLFATTGGVLKAKIDYVRIARGVWPQPTLPVSELTYAQATEISDYLNRIVYKLGTDSSSLTYMDRTLDYAGYVGMVAINNEVEAEMCKNNVAGLDNSEQLCFYDSSLSRITPQEMENKIRGAIVSTKNKQPEEVLGLNSPDPLLFAKGNAYIFLQIPDIH